MTGATKKALIVHRISFSHKKKDEEIKTPLIDDLSISVDEGEFVALCGPSGTGKSTLLKLIANIYTPDEGAVSLPKDMPVAYMPQEDLLLPWRTVVQNMLLPLELGKKTYSKNETKKELNEKAEALLSRLGLYQHRNKLPCELSGGTKKLVFFASLLLFESRLILLDEPFGAIDIHLREKLFELLHSLRTEKKCSLVFVTHDFRDAVELCDRVLLFSKGHIVKEWQACQNQQEHAHLLSQIRKAHSDFHPLPSPFPCEPQVGLP